MLALSKAWPKANPRRAYFAWHKDRGANDFKLGATQIVPVSNLVSVANMVGQRGTKVGSKGRPLQLAALAEALGTVGMVAADTGASVHMPRVGCGLAGGTWEEVGPLVESMADQHGVDVWVYDYNSVSAVGAARKQKQGK